MAKISSLPTLTTITDTTIMPSVDGGVTKKLTGALLKSYISVGYTGSASTASGSTGTIGYTGSTGTQGVIGFTGSASTASGYTGSTGTQGVIGFTGSASTASGSTGTIGYTGSTGTQGVIGYTGSASTASVSISWSISAIDNSNYTFSGPGIVSGNTTDPVLYLYKGFTYTFVNTTGSDHPFAIRVSSGGSDYTAGVSGSQTGTQTFTVPMNAPSTLYYQCTIHGGMGNVINIV